MMSLRAVLASLAVAAVALAGCIDTSMPQDDNPTQEAPPHAPVPGPTTQPQHEGRDREADQESGTTPPSDQGPPTSQDNDHGPVARINHSVDHVLVGVPFALDASSSQDPSGQGLVVAWDLGDGTTSDSPLVEHAYTMNGVYEVRLTVTDGNGSTDTAVVQITADSIKYEQAVWFNWHTTELDVLVLGVEDPVVGAAIARGMEMWQLGIADLAPDLAESLHLRIHWSTDGVPSGLSPDIYFVPQGFMAIYPVLGGCVATAPMPAGFGPMVQVAAHEFGHCLGLDHIYEDGVEYRPTLDIMGGGQTGINKCPSNINIEVLRMVFSGQQGTVAIPASGYQQAATC